MDAACVRELAGGPEIALRVEAANIFGTVNGLYRNAAESGEGASNEGHRPLLLFYPARRRAPPRVNGLVPAVGYTFW